MTEIVAGIDLAGMADVAFASRGAPPSHRASSATSL